MWNSRKKVGRLCRTFAQEIVEEENPRLFVEHLQEQRGRGYHQVHSLHCTGLPRSARASQVGPVPQRSPQGNGLACQGGGQVAGPVCRWAGYSPPCKAFYSPLAAAYRSPTATLHETWAGHWCRATLGKMGCPCAASSSAAAYLARDRHRVQGPWKPQKLPRHSSAATPAPAAPPVPSCFPTT